MHTAAGSERQSVELEWTAPAATVTTGCISTYSTLRWRTESLEAEVDLRPTNSITITRIIVAVIITNKKTRAKQPQGCNTHAMRTPTYYIDLWLLYGLFARIYLLD